MVKNTGMEITNANPIDTNVIDKMYMLRAVVLSRGNSWHSWLQLCSSALNQMTLFVQK